MTQATKTRIVFDIVDDGPPEMRLDPSGAIVWIEVETDEPGTLLADPELVCEQLLGWMLQRVRKTEIGTGRVEWYAEMLPIGVEGVIERYAFIEHSNGVVSYFNGVLQTADERARLLLAKKRFFEGK